jgi:hypothetical protein
MEKQRRPCSFVNEFSSTEFKGIELENIDAADKRNSILIMA